MRAVIAGALMTFGGGLIILALSKILVLHEPVPPSWFWVLWLGVGTFLLGVCFTVPANFWKAIIFSYRKTGYHKFLVLRGKQRKVPSEYLHLYDTRIVFLPLSGGKPLPEWRFYTSVLSQLLYSIQIDRYKVKLTSSSVPYLTNDPLAGFGTVSRCWVPLQVVSVTEREKYQIPSAIEGQIRTLFQGGGKPFAVEIVLTGYLGNKEVFSIDKTCFATFDGFDG